MDLENKGCKYCHPNKTRSKNFQDVALLDLVQSDKDDSYIKIELATGGNKPPQIATQCRMNNHISRTRVHIKFCPMCGDEICPN